VKLAVKYFIGVFLVIQVFAPAQYYALREDTNDERFAWRMFSPTRMLACDPDFTIGDATEPVDLMKEFHEAWLTIAKRGRLDVVERMGETLCERYPGQPVKAVLTCKTVEGKVERRGGYNICTVPDL
jgi:hypothetical protein